MTDLAFIDGLNALITEKVDAAIAKLRRELATHDRDEYLSTSAAARVASVSPGTLRRWIKEGRIAGQKAGRVVRIRRADLEALLRSGGSPRNDDSPAARVARDFG